MWDSQNERFSPKYEIFMVMRLVVKDQNIHVFKKVFWHTRNIAVISVITYIWSGPLYECLTSVLLKYWYLCPSLTLDDNLCWLWWWWGVIWYLSLHLIIGRWGKRSQMSLHDWGLGETWNGKTIYSFPSSSMYLRISCKGLFFWTLKLINVSFGAILIVLNKLLLRQWGAVLNFLDQ